MITESSSVQPIFFVGGAPRSGTTVTHALLCTSDRTSPYHPEISFVRPLFNAYAVGMQNWESHTYAFFKKPAHFKAHMCSSVMHSLNHVAKTQGDPEILCVKDPLLTPLFYWVHQLLGDRARFVTVVRNPYDVVRSRQEVAQKRGAIFSAADATAVAEEYQRSYAHLDAASLQGSLFVFRYEDMTDQSVITGLQKFTSCEDISPDKVWAEKHAIDTSASKDPWFSPKYHRPINTESRLDPLAQDFRAVVDRICAPMMDRFGYTRG